MILPSVRRRVLRQLLSGDYSNRKIARSNNITHTSVNRMARRVKELKIDWEMLKDKTDSEINDLFISRRPKSLKAMPDLNYFTQQLRSIKYMTQELLWEEYAEENKDNHYSRSYTNKLLREDRKQNKVAMLQNHPLGGTCQVDFAGETLKAKNCIAGFKPPQFLVCNSPASDYRVVVACHSQKIPDFLEGMNRAVKLFGGVHQVYLTDNFASAVKPKQRDTPNDSFAAWADHYDTMLSNTRPGESADKGPVEQSVLNVERWIIAPLQRMTFASLAEVNEAIKPLMQKLNERNFAQYEGNRISFYEEHELPLLKPLPPESFDVPQTIKNLTVEPHHHVRIDGHGYSVPVSLVGQVVKVHVCTSSVRVMHNGKTVVVHAKSKSQRQNTTLPEHMAPNELAYQSYTYPYAKSWAKAIGIACDAFVDKLFDKRPENDQKPMRAVSKLKKLAKCYEDELVEVACERALAIGDVNVTTVERILKRNTKTLPQPRKSARVSQLNHSNIRGAEYFSGIEGVRHD
ncbi:MAG: IS21 family transposase [Pseudomonadota bacterium]|nr:IS21 family transposase [Pseudomonadota bacterium]